MTLNPKIAGLLGFAAKGGKLLLGNYSVEEGIRRKQAKLVLAAEDINPKRRSILRLWCGDMGIPFLSAGTKEEYGILLRRKALGLLAVTDEQMALGMMKAANTDGGD